MKSSRQLRFCLAALLLIGQTTAQSSKFFGGRPNDKFGFVRPPPEEDGSDEFNLPGVTTGWYTQTLDHFNPVDGRTFQQRYFLNNMYFKPGGPLFLQIGGEGAISPYFSSGGDWVENGRRQNAIMFQLEHRFYGQTQPMPDISVSSLKYLNSEQALADIAQFIMAMKQKYNMGKAKVIVFGGSYAGAMAAWFRMKYPMVADGAISSSGPVHAKADFFEYLEVVGTAVEAINPGCYDAIQSGFSAVNQMITGGQISQVNRMFMTCTPLNTADAKNIQSFWSALYGLFQGQVQYNGQGPYGVLPLCMAMRNASLGTPAQRLAAIATAPPNLSQAPNGGFCFAYDYHADITYLRNATLAAGATGARQWTWQTCTEFGYFQTTDTSKQPFGQHVPLQFFEDVYCNEVFGTSYASIAKGISSSINIFGGLGIKVSNVVFVNGLYDPWHSLAILHSLGPRAPSIIIPDGSHCQNMGSPRSSDKPDMVAARKQIASWVAVFCHTPSSL